MRIEELVPEQSITLLVVAKNQQLEFNTTVLESFPRKHMIVAAPILQDDKIISFRGKGILIHLLVTLEDKKPHVFQNVTVLTAKKSDDTFCYTISTIAESKEFNRRGAFRCYIGVDTSVRIGSNHSTYDATIKDVSASGFAFTTSSENEFEEGDTVHAVLNDYLEETAENYSFHLFGVIVRHYTLENGNIVYGCRFTTKVMGVEHYLMEKERLRLQRMRGTTSRTLKKK